MKPDDVITLTWSELQYILEGFMFLAILVIIQVNNGAPFSYTIINKNIHILLRIIAFIPFIIFHIIAFISALMFCNLFVKMLIDGVILIWNLIF